MEETGDGSETTQDFNGQVDNAFKLPGCSAIPGIQLIRRLGSGAMGDVWEARQEGLERPVALKVLKSKATDRFLKEANAIAKMNHPGILQLYTCGVVGKNPYLVLEFVGGGSLADRLQREKHKPWQIEPALSLITKIAEATEYAHNRGVIHRDLKPANILFRESGEPILADFGLAKLLDDPTQTAPGAVMGSPAWMPPEQANGDIDQLGPQSDVFGLGAILYNLLTGKPPFHSTSSVESIRKSSSAQIEKPTAINPAIPPGLEKIILRSLSRKTEDRFQSAKEFSNALITWSKGKSKRVFVLTTSGILLCGLGISAWIWSKSGKDIKVGKSKESEGDKARNLAPLICTKFDAFVIKMGGKTPARIPLPGTIPCGKGDQLFVEASFSQPCFPYLLWLDSEGNLLPLYPWSPDGSKILPDNLLSVANPSGPVTDLVWPGRGISGSRQTIKLDGKTGFETLILLARTEALDKPIAEFLGSRKFPAQKSVGNPHEFLILGGDKGEDPRMIDGEISRGIQDNAGEFRDPVDALLLEFKDVFPTRRSIRFVNNG